MHMYMYTYCTVWCCMYVCTLFNGVNPWLTPLATINWMLTRHLTQFRGRTWLYWNETSTVYQTRAIQCANSLWKWNCWSNCRSHCVSIVRELIEHLFYSSCSKSQSYTASTPPTCCKTFAIEQKRHLLINSIRVHTHEYNMLPDHHIVST